MVPPPATPNPCASAKVAKPKSVTFTWPDALMRMLSGLISRCSTPFSCATSSACATASNTAATTSSVSRSSWSRNSSVSVMPSTYSMIRYAVESWISKSYTATMLGSDSMAAVRASSNPGMRESVRTSGRLAGSTAFVKLTDRPGKSWLGNESGRDGSAGSNPAKPDPTSRAGALAGSADASEPSGTPASSTPAKPASSGKSSQGGTSAGSMAVAEDAAEPAVCAPVTPKL